MAEAIGACCGCCGVLAVVLLCLSWAIVLPTEMALRYNYVLKTVSPQVITAPGIQFLGPFSSLIRFPKTIQTLEYNANHRDLLDGRTRDGLPLILGLAFQYRLLPDGLYNLYHTYENSEGDYLEVYRLMAIHIITEQATKFTAYQFFNEKQKIAEGMRKALDEYFQKHLFATVESLQINEDDLPQAFTDTILTSATCKQNITKMQKTQEAKVIEFQTARVVARAQANVTVQKAFGMRHQILQNGRADSAIIDAYVQAELQAYGQIHDELGLSGPDLVNYIWYDMLAGGGVAEGSGGQSMKMMVGVNPSAYISEERP